MSMKSVVILYAAELSEHAFEKIFDGKSAFELVLEWSKNVPDRVQTVVFTSPENQDEIRACIDDNESRIVLNDFWTKGLFIKEISGALQDSESDYAVISYADTPFLNKDLSCEICATHVRYSAEYTFADGYPYGFAPETLDKGTAGILFSILESSHKEKADEKMSRDAVFSALSLDINQFEVETVIAPKDYRLLRLEFECSSKINFGACRALFNLEKAKNEGGRLGQLNLSDSGLISLCDDASTCRAVLKTVPAFYNIQISSKYNHNLVYEPDISSSVFSASESCGGNMSFSGFKSLVEKIKEFSGRAEISLSAFGEPLLHQEFFSFISEILKYQNLSVLIETDGTLLAESLAQKISGLPGAKQRIDWIVLIDAMDKKLYSEIHRCNENDFEKALLSVQILEKYFPGRVYPQLVRMKANENELEAFYRFWRSPDSPSHGKFIIQKYNSFCSLLPEEKPADLSPLERNPCWKLRRDMTVLCDGSVPECINQFWQKDKVLGNVFEENLEKIWEKFDGNLKNQIDKKYLGLCKACDEHYTFNF